MPISPVRISVTVLKEVAATSRPLYIAIAGGRQTETIVADSERLRIPLTVTKSSTVIGRRLLIID